MLKIKDNVDLKELERFGFKKDYYVDEACYVLKFELGTAYKEEIIIWSKDRSLQTINAIRLMNTLYDLIQARISRKGVEMRIITKKEEQEIESIKKQNEFLSRGYRALNIALDYQNAIIAILKTLDIKEIEIDDKLFLSEDEIRVTHTINHTTIIKLVEKE